MGSGAATGWAADQQFAHWRGIGSAGFSDTFADLVTVNLSASIGFDLARLRAISDKPAGHLSETVVSVGGVQGYGGHALPLIQLHPRHKPGWPDFAIDINGWISQGPTSSTLAVGASVGIQCRF